MMMRDEEQSITKQTQHMKATTHKQRGTTKHAPPWNVQQINSGELKTISLQKIILKNGFTLKDSVPQGRKSFSDRDELEAHS